MEFLLKKEPVEATAFTTALKVKMFSGNDPFTAERELNEWLERKRIAVGHIGQSQCERNGKLLFVISVFYSDKNCNN